MVDGVKGVDRAVLIRTSMGASRRSVKKRQVLSQSLAVHPSILSAARAGVCVVGPKHARPLQGEASHWHRRHLFQGKGRTCARPGPDELIDHGEIDELVPQAQYIELRALMVRLREVRERMGLSLTDLSERTGLTRAAISRLENGWNLNPTLETLYRYTEAVGVGLKFAIDESPEPGKDG
jgi:DNA-binding XRE family transcriptional regulator